MAATKTQNRQADWSLTPRGAVSATAQGVLALAALAAVGDVAGLDPLVGAGMTVAGGLGTVLVSAHHNHAPAALIYRLCCWIGGGAWWTATLATTPWTQPVWSTLGIGALLAGLASPLARTKRQPDQARPGRVMMLRQSTAIAADWEARIQKVCRVRVQVTNVVLWSGKNGYDVHLELPGGGSTQAQIANGIDALAVDARLPNGCGIEPAPGASRAEMILRVSTVDKLGEKIPYQQPPIGVSVLDGVNLGGYRNADPVIVPVRQESVIAIGQTGSGKTILLNVLTGGVAICRDAIVWHIDLNGGSLSQVWLAPWLEGRTDRPAIDWAASTIEEAVEMCEAGLRIAKDRKTSARKLKIAANTTLMPVSPELPEIVIFLDEGAEAVSPGDRSIGPLREALEEIQRIGRDSAVRIIASSLRPTSDVLPPMIKKMSHVRIAMYVQDQSELGLMYEHRKGVSVEDLPGPGCGFVQIGQAMPRPFKSQYMLPSDVVSAAVTIANTRPELDERAKRLAGDAYTNRYNVMRDAFNEDNLDDAGEMEVRRSYQPARRHLSMVSGGGADAAAWPDLRQTGRKPAAPAAPSAATDWPDLTRRSTTLHAEQVREVEGRPVPKFLTYALNAFRGDHRMHSIALARALDVTQADLASLLGGLGVSSLPNPFERNGEKLRGYARQHLEDAADAIRRGELQVPPEVADWPAA